MRFRRRGSTAGSRAFGLPEGARAAELIAAILVVGALYASRQVLIPVALAVLLSFLLSPIVTRLQRWKLRRAPAVLFAVLLGLTAFLGVGWLVTSQTSGLAADLPSYRENIVSRVRRLRTAFGGRFGEARETIQEIRKEIAAAPTTSPTAENGGMPSGAGNSAGELATRPKINPNDSEYALLTWPWGENPLAAHSSEESASPQPVPVRIESDGNMLAELSTVLGPLFWPLTNVGIATVLVIFILLQREELLDRVICLVGRGHLHVTTAALASAASRVSRYLMVQAFVNALHGTAIAIGLELIGVPRAMLWGLLAGLLRYVPFVGTWTAAAIPILLSLAVFEDWGRPLLVAGLFVGLDLASANLMEPWLFGARTGVSPLAILLSAIFWTWLWGGLGLFLATPLTLCLVVLGQHVPQLQFLSILLSDQPALSPKLRLYQRLLALDDLGAADTARHARRGRSRVEFYDSIILPVLRKAERARSRGELNSRHQAFIQQTVRGLIEERGLRQPDRNEVPAVSQAAPAATATVLCVPARSGFDELTAALLAQVLAADGVPVRVASDQMLAAEVLELVRREAIPIVCICALPVGSRLHVRYLYKRLHRSTPHATLIVAVLGDRAAGESSAESAGEANSERVSTLDGARQAIEARCDELRLPGGDVRAPRGRYVAGAPSPVARI